MLIKLWKPFLGYAINRLRRACKRQSPRRDNCIECHSTLDKTSFGYSSKVFGAFSKETYRPLLEIEDTLRRVKVQLHNAALWFSADYCLIAGVEIARLIACY